MNIVEATFDVRTGQMTEAVFRDSNGAEQRVQIGSRSPRPATPQTMQKWRVVSTTYDVSRNALISIRACRKRQCVTASPLLEFVQYIVPGDGNCFFWAVHAFLQWERHEQAPSKPVDFTRQYVRKRVVRALKELLDDRKYGNNVRKKIELMHAAYHNRPRGILYPKAPTEYLAEMSKQLTWATQLEVLTAAHVLKRNIVIVPATGGKYQIQPSIIPEEDFSATPPVVLYFDGRHYDALLPRGQGNRSKFNGNGNGKNWGDVVELNVLTHEAKIVSPAVRRAR